MDRLGGTMGWVMNSKPVGWRMTRSISRSVQRKSGVARGQTDCRAMATEMPG